MREFTGHGLGREFHTAPTIFHYGRPGVGEKLLPGMAAELVSQNPDVLVVCCGPAISAAQKATSTIPIVVMIGAGYVEKGLVKSLRRPGGNLTGLSSIARNVIGKQLQLFKETVPGMSRMAVLYQTSRHQHDGYRRLRHAPPAQ